MATRVVMPKVKKLKAVASVLAEILREAHGKTLSPRELSISDRFDKVGITNSTQIPSETIKVFKDKSLVRVIENEDGTKYKFDSDYYPDFEHLANEIIEKVARKKRMMYEKSKDRDRRPYTRRETIPPSISKLEKAHRVLSGSNITNTTTFKTIPKGERFSVGDTCYIVTEGMVIREGRISLIEALDSDFKEIVYGVKLSSDEDSVIINSEKAFHNVEDLAKSLIRNVIRYN